MRRFAALPAYPTPGAGIPAISQTVTPLPHYKLNQAETTSNSAIA